MNTLKDTTTGETYRLHIYCACDPDQYPDGKAIPPYDKLAEPNDVGEPNNVVIVRLRILRSVKCEYWDYNTLTLKHLFKRKIMAVNVGIIISRE